MNEQKLTEAQLDELWAKFIELLRVKDGHAAAPKNFLGSIERYRQVFIEACKEQKE